ncbi:MAG: glutaminyl-peptide cyclotransferase [Syntrophobacteraceae bacterium]|nr:glutaminyl-peptide cyclotransferase [Syntrophobacteraceae bacterium]
MATQWTFKCGQVFSVFLICLCALTSRAKSEAQEVPQSCATHHLAPLIPFTVIGTYPHDPRAFTQGLVFFDGFLYESTGLNGRSSLRKVALKTGCVLKEYDLPDQYFAEGLALWGGSLIQLTWKSGKAFQYGLKSFAIEREFRYPGEGWGLTDDKKRLIMSNGSSKISFIDPKTFAVERVTPVLDGGRPVRLLNELEYIKGEIFANVWHDDSIAVISPKSGEVTGWLDFSALRSRLPPSAMDLNGIAYDPKDDRIFITGKLWPLLFEIKLSKRTAPSAPPPAANRPKRSGQLPKTRCPLLSTLSSVRHSSRSDLW